MDLSIATVGTPITYTYDTNWTDKLISYGGESIVYDAIGNPTSYRGATLTWNGRLLTSYEKGEDRFEYTYDENGLRTSKKHYDNGVLNATYHYLWQNSKLYGTKATIASSGASVVFNYLYSGNEIVGVYVNDSVLMYIKNLQGDIVSVVNTENNEIVLKYYYDAWGNISYEASESNVGAVMAILVLAATNFSYRGYFCDYETGLYYLQSRYYDPEVGRFINLDDTAIAIKITGMSLSSNLFAYCCNNPILYIDTNGYKEAYNKNSSNPAIKITWLISSWLIMQHYLRLWPNKIVTLTREASNYGDLVYIAEVMYNGKLKGTYKDNAYINYTEFSVCHSFTNKTICKEMGRWYTWVDGLTYMEVAKEIYSHAMAYYYFGTVKSILGENLTEEILEHANPINLGGNRPIDSALKIAYEIIWENTKGT